MGWKFNAPYRNGGSSRYLTIGYFISPITHCNIPKRLVKDFYYKFNFNPKLEVKASELKSHHKEYICQETVKMMTKYPDFHLGAVTVRKEAVPKHVQINGNNLYHYMINVGVCDIICDHISCKISRDNRSVKVLSGNTCIEYLQTIVWFDKNKPAVLKDNPTHSHTDDGIIFIDWITNIVWSKYEDNHPDWRNMLGEHLIEKKLYID